MDTTQIPQILPPAITISRETAVACMADDLEDYGTSGPGALAWQWALTGKGPTPIALEGWNQGPPSHTCCATGAHGHTPTGGRGTRAGRNSSTPDSSPWWLTAADGEDIPARFRRRDIAPEPTLAEHGSVTVTMTEAHRGEAFRALR